MVRYRAAWILPIARSPIRDGWIEVDRGRVSGVAGVSRPSANVREVVLGDVAVLPGLVNAHTHLELSHLRDAIPPSDNFVSWIRLVVARQRDRTDPAAERILVGVEEGIREAVACGTALVGDISNTLVTFDPVARSALAGIIFYELIRFRSASAEAAVAEAVDRIGALASENVRVSLAAHAPYSVSTELLQAASRRWGRAGMSSPFSVHLSESVEEVEFVRTGGGPWRTFLEDMGSWDPGFVAPAVGPVEYLDRVGVLGRRTLAVHGVQMSASDLARLAERGSTIVACPRSNARTGAGTPPIAKFYASGVRVAVGTDSLASTPDLNVFSELAAMRRLAPGVSAAALLESATRHGAAALGFDDFGTIEPGQQARLLAVSVPSGCDDVEECLVSGIQPRAIRWLDASSL
jgi:cytosine/adenosine deaminase-related metal-dependent hydrolase